MHDMAPTVQDIPVTAEHLCGLTWFDGLLWFSDGKLDAIQAVDPSTGQVTQRVACPGVRTGLTAWHGKLLQVVGEDWRLAILDPHSGGIEGELPNPCDGSELCGIEVSDDGLWLGFLERGVIELRTIPALDLKASIETDGEIAGVTATQEEVCYADHQASRLHLITTDGRSSRSMSLDANPTGLTWDGARFWFCAYGENRLRQVEAPKTELA